jgi:hypothetical protein
MLSREHATNEHEGSPDPVRFLIETLTDRFAVALVSSGTLAAAVLLAAWLRGRRRGSLGSGS